ncbi:hypothetical protein [Sphingopyxis sp. JAI128]|uniref:hypothetical protein n=1 Tax=Sphingopyxis sp. JAI128 TaxID=2723066 RepID=UPI00161B29C0|nr:hypothetical protein [Sphingopyxis sp. JAI128]MBB6424996.1 hypothetical protein [Sphingopyxis sp. JAI128]
MTDKVTQADAVAFLDHAFRNIELPEMFPGDIADVAAGLDVFLARTNTNAELVEALREAVAVLERLPYGDWPGKTYSSKTVAANALIRRARKALSLYSDRGAG